MTRFFESTSSVLNKIQTLTAICTLLGAFFFTFTWMNIALIIISFYVYSIIGVSMMMHRYYTHKSFELGFLSKWLLTLPALLAGRGSVLGWVYVHRFHHAYSDTEKDPHSPEHMGFRLFGFKPSSPTKKQLFIIKDLMNKPHLFINKWYVLLLLCWIGTLAMINPALAYFTWVVPVFLVHISQNCFNHFAHTAGYRNFETDDRSTNNIFLWPFILGDAWHNNHHAKPMEASTRVRKWELDPVAAIIKFIQKNVQR